MLIQFAIPYQILRASFKLLKENTEDKPQCPCKSKQELSEFTLPLCFGGIKKNGVGGSINEAQQSFTCIGSMLSAANNTTRASLTSWWELKTHWTKRLGSQLWLINLATLPYNPASIQNSGPVSDTWSFLSLAWLLEGIDTSRNRLYKKLKIKKKKRKSKINNRGIFWN